MVIEAFGHDLAQVTTGSNSTKKSPKPIPRSKRKDELTPVTTPAELKTGAEQSHQRQTLNTLGEVNF